MGEEPKAPAPAVLLYDWDNTLVDSWVGIAAALNVVFADFALPAWTVDDAKQRVRTSLRDGFSALFGSKWERALDLFYAALKEHHLRHVTPMPGALEALTAGATAAPPRKKRSQRSAKKGGGS